MWILSFGWLAGFSGGVKGLLDLDLLGPVLGLGRGFLGGVATSTGPFLCS